MDRMGRIEKNYSNLFNPKNKALVQMIGVIFRLHVNLQGCKLATHRRCAMLKNISKETLYPSKRMSTLKICDFHSKGNVGPSETLHQQVLMNDHENRFISSGFAFKRIYRKPYLDDMIIKQFPSRPAHRMPKLQAFFIS